MIYMNYKFAKLIDEETITYAPKQLKYNNKTYINPSEKIYNACGYYKLLLADYPDDGKNYIQRYYYNAETNKIEQAWMLVEE